MARIFHDGFELGRPASSTTSTGAWQNSLWQYYLNTTTGVAFQVSSTAKNGNYSLYAAHTVGTNRNVSIRRDLGSNILESYGRVEHMLSSRGSGWMMAYFMLDESDANVAHIRVRTNGDNSNLVDIALYIGTSQVAATNAAFSFNTWVRLEWHLLVDDTSGVFELKRNGDSILNYAGDTKGASSGNGIRVFGIGRNYTATETFVMYSDDIAINDTTGTVNDSWVGPGSILLLKPKGAGNYTQWTPDSGNNFARVNEIPHTGDSAYVESDTADQIDTYEMQTLADLGVDTSDPSFNVKAVQHLMIGRWDEAETELARVLRLGTTDNTGVAVTLSNTYYRYWDEMFNVSPFDSLAWELADLNSLEAGIKHVAASP